MTDLRTAAQQALEALKIMQPEVQMGEGDAAIKALKAALAEPTPSQQLAAAGFTRRDTRLECDECGCKFTRQMLPIHKCEPVQEPVATVTSETGADISMSWWHEPALPVGTPLYTAPPQRKPEPNSDYERGFVDGMSEQARRSVDKAVNAMIKCKPLAEEEIARLVTNDMVKFARAIERAHEITP